MSEKPVWIVKKGSLKKDRDVEYLDDAYADIITVQAGAPFPMLRGKFLFAEEGSILSNIPSWMTLVEVIKGSPYPLVLGHGDT